MSQYKTAYKCVSTGVSFLGPEDEPKYDVFVSVLSYGNRAGLGPPPFDIEPRVRGLLKEDAIFWALGCASYLETGGWRITRRDLEGDKLKYGIWLEDPLGARREIVISEDSERNMR